MSEGEEFWRLSCIGEWGTNDSLGGKVWQGRARGWRKLCKLTIKWASSKTIMCTSHWNVYFLICLQNCLKELAINMGKPLKKILYLPTFLKNLSLSKRVAKGGEGGGRTPPCPTYISPVCPKQKTCLF